MLQGSVAQFVAQSVAQFLAARPAFCLLDGKTLVETGG